MSRTFQIPSNYWTDGIQLFEKDKMEFKPGFTTLIGCNGAGKSTVLFCIKNQLKEKKIGYISFDNLSEGGTTARINAEMKGDMEFLVKSIVSSEGENIRLNLESLAEKIGREIKRCQREKAEELWILLDAVDSGLSIDNIVELKELFQTVLREAKDGLEIYIVAAANEYELTRGSNTFDVISGEYVSINSYDDYYDRIMESAQKKAGRKNA